jgi:integrase
MATGIEVRHAQGCRIEKAGRCNCQPSYRASAWSAHDNRRIRKTFPTRAAAKAWRSDAQVALRQGRMRAPAATTLREASEAWLQGAREGAIRTRSGDLYKPSTIRAYDQNLRLRALDEIGACRLSDLRLTDLQRFVDGLVGQGHAASTVGGTVAALHAIFRREVAHGGLAVNPTQGLQLPAIRNGRDRIADPEEAAALLEALPWRTGRYGRPRSMRGCGAASCKR